MQTLNIDLRHPSVYICTLTYFTLLYTYILYMYIFFSSICISITVENDNNIYLCGYKKITILYIG